MDNKDYKIDADSLKKMIQENKKVFILDVRPKDQREEWSIPESHYLDAYQRLNENDPTVLNEIQLPEDTTVVTVCAAGRVSQIATNELRKKGVESYSLAGGMKAWNYVWDTVEFNIGDTKIIQVRRVAKGCLSYIVGEGKEAIVIDASLNPDIYIALAEKNGWTIKQVADTHIHADYVSRTKELAATTKARHIMIDVAQVDYPFSKVKDGDIIRWNNSELKIIHTPGHTWESTSFLINGLALLSGDTLFTDGIGRPDLKADEQESGQKAEALYHSLQLISGMAKDMLILPAHISTSIKIGQPLIGMTLEKLKTSIPALSLDKNTFITNILNKLPSPPPNYLAIAGINKSGIIPDILSLADLEVGANRCAIA